jgi:hypothetical protein
VVVVVILHRPRRLHLGFFLLPLLPLQHSNNNSSNSSTNTSNSNTSNSNTSNSNNNCSTMPSRALSLLLPPPPRRHNMVDPQREVVLVVVLGLVSTCHSQALFRTRMWWLQLQRLPMQLMRRQPKPKRMQRRRMLQPWLLLQAVLPLICIRGHLRLSFTTRSIMQELAVLVLQPQ